MPVTVLFAQQTVSLLAIYAPNASGKGGDEGFAALLASQATDTTQDLLPVTGKILPGKRQGVAEVALPAVQIERVDEIIAGVPVEQQALEDPSTVVAVAPVATTVIPLLQGPKAKKLADETDREPKTNKVEVEAQPTISPLPLILPVQPLPIEAEPKSEEPVATVHVLPQAQLVRVEVRKSADKVAMPEAGPVPAKPNAVAFTVKADKMAPPEAAPVPAKPNGVAFTVKTEVRPATPPTAEVPQAAIPAIPATPARKAELATAEVPAGTMLEVEVVQRRANAATPAIPAVPANPGPKAEAKPVAEAAVEAIPADHSTPATTGQEHVPPMVPRAAPAVSALAKQAIAAPAEEAQAKPRPRNPTAIAHEDASFHSPVAAEHRAITEFKTIDTLAHDAERAVEIVEAIEAMRSEGRADGVTIAIDHGDFGPIEVTFNHAEDGVSVEFRAKDPEVTRIITEAAPVLRTAGETAGIRIDRQDGFAGGTGSSRDAPRQGTGQQDRNHQPFQNAPSPRPRGQRDGIFA